MRTGQYPFRVRSLPDPCFFCWYSLLFSCHLTEPLIPPLHLEVPGIAA
jgi:hypothetical protein